MTTRSFFEAFKDRYLDADDNVDVEVLTIKATQKYTKELVVELVGREKAIDTFKSLKNLRQIVLADSSIASLDQHAPNSDEQAANDALKANLKSNRSIRSLDISHNQIDSWTEVVRIAQLFPYLEELIVSGNPFRSIELDDLDWQVQVLANVTTLVAGRLRIDWPSIELFNKLFVNLRSLNIFDDHLTHLELADPSSFEKLEYLSLSENPVGWRNVLKLRQLKNLRHLQLNNCDLDEIVLDEPNLFANIRQLNLSGNRIGKWSDIVELAKLPHLTDLTVRDNPLFNGKDYDQMFDFVVAILKSLKVLNKQMITGEKRKEAEIYFMRTNYRAWVNGELEAWNVRSRFEELIDYYGEPVDLLKDVQVNKFLSVTLTDQQKTFKKKLLKTMDIGTLRMLVKRLFALDNDAEFELWHLNDGKEEAKSKLDQDERDLKFYSINDNATIVIVK